MAVNISDPSWSPVGESALDVFIERGNLVGTVLGGVCYGAFVTLWITCVHYELKGKPDGGRGRVSWGLLAYLIALFAAATIYFAASVKWLEQMFIDYRNFHESDLPDTPESTGPLGFYNYDYDTPMIVLANAAYVVLNFLADGLLLHRCYIIWSCNKSILVLPVLVFLASTALSIATVVNNAVPSAQFFGGHAKALATAWVVLSMCLNVGLTALIVVRLWRARRTLSKVLGPEHARLYAGIASMLTESAFLYSSLSLLFLVLYSQPASSPFAQQAVNLVLPVLSMSAALAPTLILARVARGRAWRASTAQAATGGTNATAGPLRGGREWSHRVVTLPSRPSASFPRSVTSGFGPSKTRINADIEAFADHLHRHDKAGGVIPLEVVKTEESESRYM